MANIEEVAGVYGGVKTEETASNIGFGEQNAIPTTENAGTQLPAKRGFWDKVKAVLFYEIKVELTPQQQKVEDEINEFLHQEITWSKVKDFLFQEITFGK